MIKQLLLFKFKDRANDTEIKQFFVKYKELENLDCLQSVDYGENISNEGFDKGYTHGAIATFETKENVAKFLNHPKHIKLTDNYLNPLLDDLTLVEFEL